MRPRQVHRGVATDAIDEPDYDALRQDILSAPSQASLVSPREAHSCRTLSPLVTGGRSLTHGHLSSWTMRRECCQKNRGRGSRPIGQASRHGAPSRPCWHVLRELEAVACSYFRPSCQ